MCMHIPLLLALGFFYFAFGLFGVFPLFSLSNFAFFLGGTSSSSSSSFFSISNLVPDASTCAKHFSKPLILHMHLGNSSCAGGEIIFLIVTTEEVHSSGQLIK